MDSGVYACMNSNFVFKSRNSGQESVVIIGLNIMEDWPLQEFWFNWRLRSADHRGGGRSAADRLLDCGFESRRGLCMSVSSESCVLSSTVLGVTVITRPEYSYCLWHVWVWLWNLDSVVSWKKRRNLKSIKWEEVDLVYLGLSANQGGCMGIFQVP